MSGNVPMPYLIAAIVILAVFVPLGLAGAIFVFSRVIKTPRKWTRYIVEVHTAFQSVIVLAVIAPMLLTGYVMIFVDLPLPYGLILAQTLTMRVGQCLIVVSAAATTVKRVRTAMYGKLGDSKVLELASVLLAWAAGLGIGIGSTLPTAGDFQFNRTGSESDFDCQAYDYPEECIGYLEDNYYGPVYLGVLLVTSVIMLGGCLMVIRHIQSGMAVAAPFGVFRTGVQLSFAAGNGISQDTAPRTVFLNNWVSEKKTSFHVLPSSKVGTSCGEGGSELHHATPGPGSDEHIGLPGCKTKSPELSARNLYSDNIMEDASECELDVLSILSGELSKHDYLRPDSAQMYSSVSSSCDLDPFRNLSPQTCEWTNSEHNPCTLECCSGLSLSATSDNGSRSSMTSIQDYTSATTSPLHVDAKTPSSGRSCRERLSPSAPDRLPDLRHSRTSPSSVSLKRSHVLSPTKSESHIDIQAPSSSKNWPSMAEILSLRYAAQVGANGCTGHMSPFSQDNKKQTQFIFPEKLHSIVGSQNNERDAGLSDDQVRRGSQTSDACPDKTEKEQLTKTRKLSWDNNKQTCKSGKPYTSTPVQIRVVRPSTEEMRFSHRKLCRVLDKATLGPKLQAENQVEANTGTIDGLMGTISTDSVDKASRTAIPHSVPWRQSTGSINISQPTIRNPIQLLSRNPEKLSTKEQKNARYKQSVIRRFIVAFLVNVLTQIPYVALQLAKPEYQTYKTVQPVVESISVISFALSTYIYVLGNKVIHKLLISTRK